jgi:hypothetical protein
MTDNFNLFLPLSKVERQKDGSVTVAGYASTPALDLDNEIVSLDAVRKALPGYWEWRNIREMHQPSAVGTGTESHVDDRGLFLTARITDPTAAQKCLDQVYKGFSIGGKKLAKTGNTITEIELIEVSVVDRPANPECRIEVAKRYKERSAENGGYLVKVMSGRNPASRALTKMAQAVEIMAKSEPGQANDGFHFPPTKKSEDDTHVHEIDCDTGPPIAKTDDMKCAAHDTANCPICAKKSEKAGKSKTLLKNRAAQLGIKLPPNFKRKLAKKLIRQAEEKAEKAVSASVSLNSAQPSFLTLGADDGRGPVEGQMEKSGHELPPGLELRRSQPLRDGPELELRKSYVPTQRSGEMTVQIDKDELSKLLEEHLAKAGRPPSRVARMDMARGNMKKAKSTMKECSAAIKAAHSMHKEAYMSKMAKKAKPESGDFDHETAMKYLQKAYGDLSTLKTFVKAADMQIKKAAGRTGQTEQSPTTGNEFYRVPAGVDALSESELVHAGPGSKGGGSDPIDWGLETGPKKMAKTYWSQAEVQALTRAAAAEAKVDLLEKMPAMPSSGRKPHLFDTTKLGLGNSARDSTSLFEGVSEHALVSDDESIRKSAVGKVIGNMIVNGHGRQVFDPSFHGTAGAKA